ncbi:MAG: hypothetical protein L0229_05925 [Blastocatellia bacterium]|nr:hypothetical protein [Blastocatellia bacterium]
MNEVDEQVEELLSLSANPEFMEIIDKAREEFKTGRKLTLEEMKQEFLDGG